MTNPFFVYQSKELEQNMANFSQTDLKPNYFC